MVIDVLVQKSMRPIQSGIYGYTPEESAYTCISLEPNNTQRENHLMYVRCHVACLARPVCDDNGIS
jgi:hypothetical protein